jgi:hypothetical protein
MNSIDLHAVVLTEQSPSAAAIILRNGGYMVTRTRDEERAAWWMEEGCASALIIDLPMFAAARVLRRLQSISPELAHRAIALTPHMDTGRILPSDVLTLNRSDSRAELIRAVDRLCIDAALRERLMGNAVLQRATG